ncbi:hypothetical protein EZV62_006007 [Acer yangbiense]|uniref:Uncharacterized protein n=1 Tax=Acer yangbiense TaxID=1000413 RepID=A0A5C7IRV4_9ROSI|nr:hypothetical protein EZV62_006007 [Acer yangbiense]
MSSSNARDINLTPCAFTKMKKLRLLNFYVNYYCGNKVHVSEDLIESDFIELKYFHWYGCPLKSLQPKFHFEKLVILEMRNSNIEELWSSGVQPLHNLKSINLSRSKHLISCPDFSTAPNLESLILVGCTSLSEIPSSIQHLNKLRSLKLRGCTSLSEIPSSIQHLNKLKYLDLGFCKSLESIPDYTCLESLKLLLLDNCSKLKRLPQLPTNLETIHLIDCTSLVEIQSSFTRLHKLRSLMLRGCTSLSEIPSSIQHLNKLEYLDLEYCENLESIPDCTRLESLKELILDNCSKLKRLPQLPTNLETIGLIDCTSLVEIQSSFTRLHKVPSLILQRHKRLTSIPDLRGLKSLEDLHIKRCPKLKMLPELPNTIEELTLEDVPIEEFPPSSEDLDRLCSLSLNNCSMLKSLPSSIRKWKSLTDFELENCPKIDKLPDDIGALESLERFTAEGTAIGEVPSSISCLKRLTSLSMERCEGVDGVGLLLPPNLLGLENLYELILSDCGITKLPDSLGDLTSLEFLVLDRNNFGSIPGSIINLSELEYLDISYCERLRELPQLPAGTCIKAVNCTLLERSSYFAFQNDIFETQPHWKANFINCYNLDPDALNDVVKDTLLKIQGQAAFATKVTLSKHYYNQVPVYENRGSIIYPESKIPEWFHFQNRGSFIDVKLPPLWLNCNFLCIALCVVVAIPNPDRQCNRPCSDGHGCSEVTCEFYVKSKDGNRRVESNLYGYHCRYTLLRMRCCGPDYMKSNHVIIGFGYDFFREFCDNEFSFQFNVKKDAFPFECEHCKVEMCGVHLMSGLHFETSNENKVLPIQLVDSALCGSSAALTPDFLQYRLLLSLKYDKAINNVVDVISMSVGYDKPLFSYNDQHDSVAIVLQLQSPDFPSVLKGNGYLQTIHKLLPFSSTGPSSMSKAVLKLHLSSIIGYALLSGTSTACPLVARIVALIKSAHQDWSPDAIRSALESFVPAMFKYRACDGAVTENRPDKHERKQYFRLVMNERVFLREYVTNNHHMSKLHSRNGGID